MGLAVERLPLTLHWKKLYISGRSNDNDNLLGIDYGGSHIVALQRSSERRKTKQGEEWRLTHRGTPAKQRAEKNKARRRTAPAVSSPYRLASLRLTADGIEKGQSLQSTALEKPRTGLPKQCPC